MTIWYGVIYKDNFGETPEVHGWTTNRASLDPSRTLQGHTAVGVAIYREKTDDPSD